jgi:hypothetical protein
MWRFNRSKLFVFIFGFALGFGVLLWLSRGPCYSQASILSFFEKEIVPCNSHALARQTKKDAVLELVPATTSVKVGQSFSLALVVDPKGIDINAVGVRVDFPSTTLLTAKDETMSPFPLHLTDPTASSDLRRAIQVIPNPGITASATIAEFTFKVLTPGTTTIIINSSSIVLANDGFGTDVLGSIKNAAITVYAAP